MVSQSVAVCGPGKARRQREMRYIGTGAGREQTSKECTKSQKNHDQIFPSPTDFQFRVEDHDFLRGNEEVHFGRWLRLSFWRLIFVSPETTEGRKKMTSHERERKKIANKKIPLTIGMSAFFSLSFFLFLSLSRRAERNEN